MSWKLLFRLECRHIMRNEAILLTVFGGLLLYAFLYPRPYLKQTPHNQQIAVINADGSQLSRKLERMVNASSLLAIKSHAFSIEEAQQMLMERKIGGLLVIPENFYRDLMLGRSPTLSYAGDASYFLVYSTIIEGLATISATLAAEVKVAHMVIDGVPLATAAKLYTPVKLSSNAVFNAPQGYLDYVLPAVFIIILHQTLFIVIGLHAGPAIPQVKPNYTRYFSAWQLVLIRGSIFACLYLVMSTLYLGFVLNYYGVHHWASIQDIYIILLPFLIATTAISLCIAEFLPTRDYSTIVGVMTSLPIVFSCGFIWPLESIPVPINLIADLIPAKPMILGILKINQMGASLQEIKPHFIQLWSLSFIYTLSAIGIVSFKQKKNQQGISRITQQ
jgi:ABC-2 type transport system permease protein